MHHLFIFQVIYMSSVLLSHFSPDQFSLARHLPNQERAIFLPIVSATRGRVVQVHTLPRALSTMMLHLMLSAMIAF